MLPKYPPARETTYEYPDRFFRGGGNLSTCMDCDTDVTAPASLSRQLLLLRNRSRPVGRYRRLLVGDSTRSPGPSRCPASVPCTSTCRCSARTSSTGCTGTGWRNSGGTGPSSGRTSCPACPSCGYSSRMTSRRCTGTKASTRRDGATWRCRSTG